MKTKYCNDMIYRLQQKSKVNEAQKRKYNGKSQKNEKVTNTQKINNCRTTYRDKIKESMKTFKKHRYHNNITFQEKVKEYNKNMYSNNVRFRENLKQKMKERAKDMYNNPSFKQNKKERMKKTRRHLYQNNQSFKQKIKIISKDKYKSNPMYRHKVKENNFKRSENKKHKMIFFFICLNQFKINNCSWT